MERTLSATRLARYERDQVSEPLKRQCGQATSSHGGMYVYRGKALLNEIPHVRLIPGGGDRADGGRETRRWVPGDVQVEVYSRKVALAEKDRNALRTWVCAS